MLALIIACSTVGDVCTYRTDTVVTRSLEDCRRLGHFIGGRTLVQAYGMFTVGTVDVTCRPLVAPITVAEASPRRS